MTEQKVKKRGWVKNAAIIFLSIMLILTFFSNTWMNRTLPEVAAQYVQSGSINTQIRGTGTVSANESFEVITDQTRTVLSVPVKLGEKVEVDQVLLNFASADSEEIKSAQENLDNALYAYKDALIDGGDGKYSKEKRDIERAQKKLNEANAIKQSGGYSKEEYDKAKQNLTQAQNNLNTQQKVVDELQKRLDGGEDVSDQLAEETTKLEGLSSILDESQAKFDEIEAKKQAYDQADDAIYDAQDALEAALTALETAKKADQKYALNLEKLKKEVDDATATLNELKGGNKESVVKSRVNGVVTELNISAGNTTTAGEPIMVVEVPDRGYVASISVTPEQAKKVRVGDSAEILYGYWGSDLKATLSAIKSDPASQGKNKLLVFELKGDAESGAQLELAIGERGGSYDIIVPNSAIRTDSNGSFVLAVVSKSGPLGNRYMAKRVDVTVEAKDDVNSAVTGALSYNDFVITSSTKPIEPGMQVRLAEN